jgi:hypothetical protein
MTFTDEEIDRFIEAWNNDFGEVLTREVAVAELRRLLFFFDTIARAFHGKPRHGAVKPRRDTILP